jgi:hypothetical protein
MEDATKQPWHKYRDAMTESSGLLGQDARKALSLVDESIAQAIRENEPLWVRTLCHHAAIISGFLGDQQLVEHYYQQSLAFVPDNPAALYGLAKAAQERGELETARLYAARCYKAISDGDDDIMKQGLLDLVIKHWPEVADR